MTNPNPVDVLREKKRASCAQNCSEANPHCQCDCEAELDVAALEAAGYRLLSAETTHPMDNAVAEHFSGSLSDWRRCWSDLHAAAPLFGKGSEKL